MMAAADSAGDTGGVAANGSAAAASPAAAAIRRTTGAVPALAEGPVWDAVMALLGHTAHASALAAAWQVQYDRLVLHLREHALVGEPGAGPPVMLLPLRISALPVTVAVTEHSLAEVYFPLLVLCNELARRHHNRRALLGIVAPAGAGKTTLAQVLQHLQHTLQTLHTGTILPGILCLSMDAYHYPNARLDELGLRAHKGRIDTIDAAEFARDVRSLRADGRPAVRLPEYDRAVTHDPVANVLEALPEHGIVLVEGLYLCASNVDSPSDMDPAWRDARTALDLVIFLSVAPELSRHRTIARKVSGGRSHADAELHYARVDAPVLEFVLRSVSGATVRSDVHLGADMWLGLLDVQHANTEAITVRVSDALVFSASPDIEDTVFDRNPGSPASTLVLGLNPCVQRTLMFQRNVMAGETSAPVGWIRGEVNRANEAHVGIGGKGQYCACAMTRHTLTGAASTTAQGGGVAKVHLVQFLGGTSGKEAAECLERHLALICGPSALVASDVLVPLTIDVGEQAPTRTCTTVIDDAAADTTELIEPSAPVAEECTAAVIAAVQRLLATGSVRALAFMGTAPPGASNAYRDVASACLASAYQPSIVLLDGYKNVTSALQSGAVTMLKVNAAELAHLADEMGAYGVAKPLPRLFAAQAVDATVAHAIHVLEAFVLLDNDPAGRGAPGLQAVAVTAGPAAAWLIQRTRPHRFAVTQYLLPKLPREGHVLNPIGAGDTVAGVLLAELVTGTPMRRAFCVALAAGSASVMTRVGAVWAQADAADICAGITTRSYFAAV